MQEEGVRRLQQKLLPALASQGAKKAAIKARDVVSISLWVQRPRAVEMALKFKEKDKVLGLDGGKQQNSQVISSLPKALRRLLEAPEEVSDVSEVSESFKKEIHHFRGKMMEAFRIFADAMQREPDAAETRELCDRMARLCLLLRPSETIDAEEGRKERLKGFLGQMGLKGPAMGRMLTHFKCHLSTSRRLLQEALQEHEGTKKPQAKNKKGGATVVTEAPAPSPTAGDPRAAPVVAPLR
ncbi:unnamed protein product [Effrenium voratum]|uniref:Uncharacterized protein n=1 Tax=Effrenium voratum TaxID=2562239 RepID=A0AA36I5S5_9DINO|nr:unnamed protein product [Effrenium voratum]